MSLTERASSPATRAYLVCALLVVPLLAGCTGSNPLHEFESNPDRTRPPLPEILRVPDRAEEGVPFLVEWRILESKQNLTAWLRYGNVSVQRPLDESPYTHAIELANTSGRSSVYVMPPSGMDEVFLRIYVLDDSRTYWSDEVRIEIVPLGSVPSVVIVRGPDYTKVGETMSVRAEVRSQVLLNVSEIELRFGRGDATIEAFPLVLAGSSGSAPGDWRLEGKPRDSGFFEYRVRAVVDGEEYWSAPKDLLVASEGEPTVELVSFLSWARVGESISAQWRVHFPGHARIETTHLVWGAKSHADGDELRASMYPNATRDQSGVVPAGFGASFPAEEPGKYFMRIRVVHDGTEYWSQEYAFTIAP